VKLGRALLGYKRAEAERVLDDVANSFEDVWRDRGELTDKVEELQRQLDEHRQREHLMTQALIAAERAAAEAREAARRQAELIIAEAHQEARSVLRGAQSERERLAVEARRIETLLRSALGLVEEGAAVASWPERSDTREFAAVSATAPGTVASEPPATDPARAEEPATAPEPLPSREFEWG
jgi:cell division initiation protein